jgi:splicing factor 3A subunit 2
MDAYALKNRLGAVECKLCRTVHPSEANYLVHTRGRRHRQAVKRREERDTLRRRFPETGVVSGSVVNTKLESRRSEGTEASPHTPKVECWRLPGNAGFRIATELSASADVEVLVTPQPRRLGQEIWLIPAVACMRLEQGSFVTRVRTRRFPVCSGAVRFEVDLYVRRD